MFMISLFLVGAVEKERDYYNVFSFYQTPKRRTVPIIHYWENIEVLYFACLSGRELQVANAETKFIFTEKFLDTPTPIYNIKLSSNAYTKRRLI